MFTRKDYLFLAAAILLVLTAFVTMAFDPSENGMGILTRTIAPIILLAGLLLPIPVILGRQHLASDKLQVAIKKTSLETLAGIAVFAIAFSIYLFTLEPTASLWDCSEFIASAYKLQVPHTPGAPLSLLIGRIFTLFAWGDVTRVACMVNAMSAFFSALTVLLVYIIILVLGKRMENVSIARPALIVAATAGSLCLAVSDTFWFSAVEAETYGASCFFMVLIVWLIFTGQDLAEPDRSRRLVLIFYIAGLSYCIHPMSLLSLPILPVAWYSSSRAWWRILLWTAVGALIILFINRFIAVGIFELAFYVDLFLVNSLGFA
ncbi:MAG TPA: DUF2723 domain-containing protein, partial [Ohtaekwangia sp.]|uniref:glycosyltransferase family 117 protein n=1 Tax=Ohtaekwangia sp. TaxID=2066019 RepID=UPI002F95DE4B